MRFYAIYVPIANRPGYWSRAGELFTDCEEAERARSETRLRDAIVVEGEELCEFRAVLPEEEVLKRRIAAATAS